MKMKNKMPL